METTKETPIKEVTVSETQTFPSSSTTNTNSVKGIKSTSAVSIDGQCASRGKSTAVPMKEDEFLSMKGSLKRAESSSSIKGKLMDMHGVRIRPSVVRFDNAFENQTYSKPISVQNISNASVTVRILVPKALSFRVTPLDRGHLLAPGLKLGRLVHYTCTKNGLIHSSLPIYINENLVNLPLEASRGQAFVEISPTTVQFGRIDIGCKPVEKKIRIKNISFCATKFLVDLGNNELDLHVGPMKGWIRPHSSATISVKVVALREGFHTSEIWVTTDLCQTRISVEVEACTRNFIVSHPNTIGEFTLVDFPKTFYGCRKYQTLVVHNMAASSSAFVVLADYGIKGQEPFREAKEGSQPHVKMFDIEPVEGRMKPFEGRIFTIWFNPIMIRASESNMKNNFSNATLEDHLCAIRIKRIQVDEADTHFIPTELHSNKDRPTSPFPDNNTNSSLKLLIEKDSEEETEFLPKSLKDDVSVLLYLYGEAEMPSLAVIPDALYFPDTPVGTTVIKVVQLTNNTSQMLAFHYIKIPFFDVSPHFKQIAPKSAYDVSVSLRTRNIGDLKRNLTFEVLADDNTNGKRKFHVVNHVTVKIFGEIKSQKADIKPKINPGITPLITHEVGFLTDNVTFVSKIEKPRCALAVKAKLGRPWHLTNATIAFPNDRPITLRPRPTDSTAKTIYKGLPRFQVPLDKSETFTVEEMIQRKAHANRYLKYVRGTAAIAVSKDCCCNKKNPEPMLDPPIELFKKKELNPKHPCEILVPLTFVQLYRIKIHPELLNFGSVTASKSCSQSLTISNDNSFKISAKVVPVTTGIQIQTLEHFVVREKSVAKVMITFHRESLGRYSGSVTCIINGFHSFDIVVVAEVVYRSLTITPQYVEVKIPDIPFADLCVPVAINNPLNIPVSFSWSIPQESPIKIEPTLGVAPKLGTVYCGVFFEPENPNYKLYPLKLLVEGSVCLQLKTGVVLPKTNVYFVEPVLNVGCIPINLTTSRQFTIFNPDFSDAMFVVLNKEPIKGVKVVPSLGTIKAKSCHSLLLKITIPQEKNLDFTVYMTVQNTRSIEMKVTGQVIYPEVELNPKYINLHRVPCNSVSRHFIVAENKSKVKAEVDFKMDEYPQFKVSLSKRYHDPGLATDGFTLYPGASQKFYLHFIPKDLASYEFDLPVVINKMPPQDLKPRKSVNKIGNTASSSSQTKKSITTGTKKCKKPHEVSLYVVVIKPSLAFSHSEIFFSLKSEVKTCYIKNTSEKPIVVLTRLENFLGIFDVSVDNLEEDKNKGSFKFELSPGDSRNYTIKFIGALPGNFITDMNILTSFEEYSCLYNVIRLVAKNPWPVTLASLVKEIYFQPVPLNVGTSYTLHLKVTNNQPKKHVYISSEITDPFNDLFSVEYPKSKKVDPFTDGLVPIILTFQSSYSVALRKHITFKVSECDSECVVTMVATADNCLLTTYNFINSQTPNHQKFSDEASDGNESVGDDRDILSKIKACEQSSPKECTSSGSSNLSCMSLKTYVSPNTVGCKRDSFARTHSVRGPKNENEKKIKILPTHSDLEMPLYIIGKIDKESFIEESVDKTRLSDDDEGNFPMFPLESTASENAVFMNSTLNAVQQWAYEQVFCCSYNPIFGSNSFSSFSVADNTKRDYGYTSKVASRNVFDALEKICGRRVRRYFTSIDKIPEEKTAKAMYTYNLYRQLVEFMEAQGAMMAHIEPRYLMGYDEYCSYQKAKHVPDPNHEQSTTDSQHLEDDNLPEIITSEKFLCISVQCWLDLFLQIFKTLVLGPAVGVNFAPNTIGPATGPHHKVKDGKNLYGRAEEVLLTWLTHQYNSQRTVVWPNKPPPSRTVANFDSDLSDGLVLTAATAAFCPYLTQIYFQGMCMHPTTICQAYHNTTCLCMAWTSIKLGFSITPKHFVNANSVNMLLLVTHLYRVLPSYKPEATITFSAILNASESHIVALENDEEVNITYYVEIIPPSSNFVLEDCQDLFVLKRNSKATISVQYNARNTNKSEAILLLCGSCMPPKFGRNYVFKLEGYPFKLPVSSSFNIVSPLNVPIDAEITVQSPHTLDFKAEDSYSYDLWVAYTEPQPENINALSWAKERKNKIPRRLYFTDNSLVVTQRQTKCGSGVLKFKVCCFTNMVKDYWLLFRNRAVGDFIVKLQVTSNKPQPTLTLQVEMNEDAACDCSSEFVPTCNRTMTVRVPCCNLDQWSAVKLMFELTTSAEEKEFWATYLDSNIGFRLLKWILEEKREKLNKELELLFEQSKMYRISCPSHFISCTQSLQVPHVRSKSYLPLQIHVDRGASSHNTILNMTSSDGFEMRIYNLKVVISKD